MYGTYSVDNSAKPEDLTFYQLNRTNKKNFKRF